MFNILLKFGRSQSCMPIILYQNSVEIGSFYDSKKIIEIIFYINNLGQTEP